METESTSYCGLYCRDCIPSNAALFSLLRHVEKMLDELQLAEYAALKSERNPALRQYPAFLEVLLTLLGLKCPGPCRGGGGKAQCEVRACAIAKGAQGCWECDARPSCDRLSNLRRAHPNLDHNLDLIGRLGPEDWPEHRKTHYPFQKERGCPGHLTPET